MLDVLNLLLVRVYSLYLSTISDRLNYKKYLVLFPTRTLKCHPNSISCKILCFPTFLLFPSHLICKAEREGVDGLFKVRVRDSILYL